MANTQERIERDLQTLKVAMSQHPDVIASALTYWGEEDGGEVLATELENLVEAVKMEADYLGIEL